MKHLSFRSAAATLSGKKKELVAKEEAKYHLAFENEQRARRDLELLGTKYDTTKSKVILDREKERKTLIFITRNKSCYNRNLVSKKQDISMIHYWNRFVIPFFFFFSK